MPDNVRLRQTGWALLFVGLAAALGAGVAKHSTALAGGAMFLVVVGWLSVYWRRGVLFLLVLASVDGFIKYYYGSFWTYVLKDVVLAGIVVGVVFWARRNPKAFPRGRWFGLPFVLLYIAFDAAEILIPSTGRTIALAGFRAQAMYAVLFFIGAIYFDSTQRVVRTALVAIGGITFAAAVGILQYVLGPTWLDLGRGFTAASSHYIGGVGSDPSMAYRAYGTMVDPTALGLACGFAIIYSLGMLFVERAWPARTLLVLSAAICGAALYFTATRSAIVGVAVGLVLLVGALAARRDSRRYIAVVLAIVVGVGVIATPFALELLGSQTQTRFGAESENYALATRQRSIDYVFQTAGQRLFGFGLGVTGAGGRNRPEQQFRFSVDNVYLTALYETGPFGLLALLAVQGALLFLTLRAALRAENRRLGATYAVIAGGQASLLVAGWFNQGSFVYAPLAQIFWLFAGTVAMPQRIAAGDPATTDGVKRRIAPLLATFRPLGDPRRIALATRMSAPGAAAVAVRPLTEADIEAAIARFSSRMRARLLELAEAGHWSQYSADELFGRAGRELFIDLKKALAALETDPFSRDGANAVIGSSVEVAALMMMLADKFSNELPETGAT